MSRIRTRLRIAQMLVAAPIVLLAASGHCAAGQRAPASAGALLDGFEAPPQSASPRVWWHWMNGNVTEEGIKKDLAWMHEVGIGGVDEIDAALATPSVVKEPLVYMTPGWRDAFRYAAHLAGQYGMEFSIDSSPGWSESGGPWVKPEEAMKKLVWSATVISGGKPYHELLPRPPSNTGSILDAPMASTIMGPDKFAGLRFYRDSLVIAYRAPVLDPRPSAASSAAGPLNAQSLAQLSDGSLTDGVSLPASDGKASLVLQYDQPVRIQGVTLAVSAWGPDLVSATVLTSLDGTTWRSAGRLLPSPSQFDANFPERTISFAPVMTRYVRVDLTAIPPRPGRSGPFAQNAPGVAPIGGLFGTRGAGKKPSTEFRVQEFVAHSRATVNEFEAKADYSIVPDYYALASAAAVAPGTAVSPKDVVDLARHMKPDGRLDWTPPPGQWVVLRMGYSLEGTTNHPAPAAETGLEVDKLNRADVKDYAEHYLDLYQAITGPFGRGSVTSLTTDSTEVGMQNWTDSILSDFRRLRGYDPVPWLPALTGVVVGSPAQSDRFLWDFRRTINELLATNHYEELAAVARARGLFTYGEALEDHRPTFGDDMEMRQYARVPMGAMWTYGKLREPFPTYVADLRGAASIAHIYGQNIVAAESMTSAEQPWAYAPRELKPVIDMEFVLGVNRIFVHESAHQPLDKPPGLSLFIFGQMFDRLENWAPEAGAWVKYMARCSYLLQQGQYAGDIAYFYGQEAPITSLFGDRRIDVPHGYGFDFVDSDVLEHNLSVDHGQLVTPTGMRYRVLYLGGSSRFMTLRVLRRLDQLVRAGATVIGRKPMASPSLKDDPARFRALADALFGSDMRATERRVGAGKVFPSGSLPQALAAIRLQPDFQYTRPESDTELREIHRRLDGGGDLYFVSNRLDRPEDVTATFRVAGRVPELWDAVSGEVTPASFKSADGVTQIPLRLPPYGSIFVVFRYRTRAQSASIPDPKPETLLKLGGPWIVSFQTGRGAPPSTQFPHLSSWSESSIPGVKYFSGTGTYTKTFQLSGASSAKHLFLDLGQVYELAEVTVNGQEAGVLWTPPFRIDISKYIHPGTNTVSIAVTNLWVNRLIGDQQPGIKEKYTFTTIPTYRPDAPLRQSGLLGPVRIEQAAASSARM